jgi:hypothetical protein
MHSQRPCYLREPRLNCDQIVGSALCLIWLKAVPTLPTNVPRGIMLGLVLGKSGGIGLVSWFAVKAGLAALPEGATLGNWSASASPGRCSSAPWRLPTRHLSRRHNWLF